MSSSEATTRTDIKDFYYPLFCLYRSHVPEIRIDGLWGFASYDALQERKIFTGASDDLEKPIVARSILKPWQLKNTGILERINDTNGFLAIGMASQSADPEQLKALQYFLKLSAVPEASLQCPASHPLSLTTKKNISEPSEKKSIFHPCAGKHLMHLWACKINGWDLESYRDQNHPLQVKLKQYLASELGEEQNSITMATDSCGLPSAVLTLRQHLKLWLNLSLSKKSEDVIIRSFFLQYPHMIGGSKRIDTEMMQASKNSIAVKEGADGILILQDLVSQKKQSLFIKIACGFYPQLISTGVLGVLKKHQNLLCEGFLDLMKHLEKKNELGKPSPNGGGHRLEFLI